MFFLRISRSLSMSMPYDNKCDNILGDTCETNFAGLYRCGDLMSCNYAGSSTPFVNKLHTHTHTHTQIYINIIYINIYINIMYPSILSSWILTNEFLSIIITQIMRQPLDFLQNNALLELFNI